MRTSINVRVDPPADPAAERQRLGLRWWRELLYVAVFYLVYSAVRNRFGSASVSPERALEHARAVIDLERSLGLFVEQTVQGWFVTTAADGSLRFGPPGGRAFISFWNVFYGTFHFVVTAGALGWLFRRFPDDYARWRNTLALTTGLALVGFAFYPLMPPRLLTDCGQWGGCLTEFSFIDTLARVGGLWSFDSGTMQAVSNQYAAMPSLHFGWSMWCMLVLYPRLHATWSRSLVALYPVFTLWAIVVTANHFWLDAAGGAAILAVGYLLGSRLARATTRRRLARLGESPAEEYRAGAAGGQPPQP